MNNFFAYVLIGLSALFSLKASAQTFVGMSVNIGPVTAHCNDANGFPVRNFQASVGQAAMSTFYGGAPAIFIDPSIMAAGPVQFAVFGYAHECAHQSLGHLVGAAGTSHVKEFQADCRAAKDVRNFGWLPPGGFSVAMSVLNSYPGTATHPPGSARVASAWNCYNNP